jgi:hypothetical protein
MESTIAITQKLEIKLQNDPLILGIYSKEHMSGYNRDTCTLMCIAALFWKLRKFE